MKKKYIIEVDESEIIEYWSEQGVKEIGYQEYALNSCPSIKVKPYEERPHGEWIHLQAIGDYKCSICGAENLYKYTNEHERWIKTNSNFCPNCGADMRKGGAENE